MTDFRTIDQIESDFRRLETGFTQVTRRNQLWGFLVDHAADEVAASDAGEGPIVFDLGILAGPEWEGVRRFLESRLVSGSAREEFRQLEEDLLAADTNGDRFLNNPEVVTFAQAHADRWPNVTLFRTTADVYLNRLPAYLAQPDLTRDQVSDLWGLLNHYAGAWDREGVASDRRGTLYGLSLHGFPSTDQSNPPDLIRRAHGRDLTPEELAAVHRVVAIQRDSDGRIVLDGEAPLLPEEIGALGMLLERAGREGRAFQGMTISAPMLTLRAALGTLTPAETALLRRWMAQEEETQGLSCDGPLDCMKSGIVALARSFAENPGYHLLHNGVFIGGSILYRRFLLRNAFERRLSRECGGSVANPRQAYRDYERFVRERAATGPLWSRLPRRILQNPLAGLAIFNFGILPGMDRLWDRVTGSEEHPVLDFVTDGAGILAFEAIESFDAFFNRGIGPFAQSNPQICRSSDQGDVAPAPLTVTVSSSVAIDPQQQLLLDLIGQGELMEPARQGLGLDSWVPTTIGLSPRGAGVTPQLPLIGLRPPLFAPVVRPIPILVP